MTLLDWAQLYASQGWLVLPLYSARDGRCLCGHTDCPSPGKHPFSPLVPNGAVGASRDPATLKRWFTGRDDLNIGIAAGPESGLVILDVDPDRGGLTSLANYDPPETPMAMTGGGGQHYYLKHPGTDVRNSSDRLAPGLDIRGHHGYCVAPPSTHVSGRQYQWRLTPGTVPLAQCPAWITDLDRTPATVPQVAPGQEIIPQGQRETTLVRLAGAMRRQGALEPAILAALIASNERCRDLQGRPAPLDETALRRIAKSVSRYTPEQLVNRPHFEVINLAGIQRKTVDWLWPGRIPIGKLTLLAGDGGIGKSYLSMYIAAIVTCGGHWPDTSDPCPRGRVCLIGTEDDADDTILPRLQDMGGEPSLVDCLPVILTSTADGKIKRHGYNITKHRAALEDYLSYHTDTRLLIIDPIEAYVGKETDSHKVSDVRDTMEVLVDIARQARIATLCITHLNKSGTQYAAYRVSGSGGYVHVARAVWVLVEDEADAARRLLSPIKVNCWEQPTTIGYKKDGPRLLFDDPCHMSADEAMGLSGAEDGRQDLREAVEWLRDRLQDGPVERQVVEKEGRKAGHSVRCMRKAVRTVCGKPIRPGGQGAWLLKIKPQNNGLGPRAKEGPMPEEEPPF